MSNCMQHFSLYDNRYMRAGPYLRNPIRPLGERPPGGPRLAWRTPSPDEHRRRNPGCGHMAKHVLETAYVPGLRHGRSRRAHIGDRVRRIGVLMGATKTIDVGHQSD